MTIIHIPNIGFECQYSHSKVKKAKIRYEDNSITFEDDYEQWSIRFGEKIKLEPYQEQFGIAISPNYNCFFVQTWEKGLFCYHLKTGNLIWQIKICHAYEVFLSDQDFILCFFKNSGVYKINIATGAITQCFRIGIDNCHIWEITSKHYLLGVIRNKYLILDQNLQIRNQIPESLINPNHYETCMVHNASYANGLLTLEITEYSAVMLKRHLQSLDKALHKRINRTIQLDLYQ